MVLNRFFIRLRLMSQSIQETFKVIHIMAIIRWVNPLLVGK